MDRQIFWAGAVPLDTDYLNEARFTMTALGKFIEMFVGTTTLIDGFTCIPTVPASLVVQVTPGIIIAEDVIDSGAYGSLAPDATPLMKMGQMLETQQFTITPPTTSGYAQDYLIQVAFSEVADTPVLLPYYNEADPDHPFEGPADSGVEQDTRVSQYAIIDVKPGTAAPAGTQSTPAADSGYVPAFYVTVAQGQATITSADINAHDDAPFISSKLPDLIAAAQEGAWNWSGVVGGTANAITAAITPARVSLGTGGLTVEAIGTHDNTDATTINLCELGPIAVKKYGTYDLDPGDILAGGVFRVTFDGSYWQLVNPATETSRLDKLSVKDITLVRDNANVVLPTGAIGEIKVDFDCTIVGVYVLADQVGSCVIDVWKDTFANYPPTIADTICASAKPTIVSDAKYSDTTLTGWTKTISAGDVLKINLDSVSTITRITVQLKVAMY
jgi:hypothetical protein